MNMGPRIKEARKGKKLTQGELAEQIGVSPASVAMYETGKREPYGETLVRLADALDVTTDFLLGRNTALETPLTTPPSSPALATAFAAMIARCKVRGTQQIYSYTGRVLSLEEIDRLRAGESPAIIPEERLVRFLRKMDVRDIVAWFDAAGQPLPADYQDLEADVRQFAQHLKAQGVIDREEVELVVQILRDQLTVE
jgi:transcriptional regulator with XRE-family HTH domain